MPKLPPLEVIATWPKPDMVDPDMRSPVPLMLMGAGLGTLALVGTTMRFYYRSRAKQLAVEDWTLLFALVNSLGLTVLCCWAYYHAGWGQHAWDLILKLNTVEKLLQCILAAKILHQLSVAACRVSVVLFYTRLLNSGSNMSGWWVWCQWLAIALSVAGGTVFILASIFQCQPVDDYWHILKQRQCLDEGAVSFFFGLYNILMDVMVFSLPIPVIMKLKMPLHERISVIAILCIGFFTVICSVLKAYYIYEALIGSYDQTWWTMPLWTAATVENNLVIICACVPILNKPLLSSPLKGVSRFFGFSRSRSDYRQYNSHGGGYSLRQDSHAHRTHSSSNKKGHVVLMGKHCEVTLPIHGIVVTREFEKEYRDRNGNLL